MSPENLMELTKYGLSKAPKLAEGETYVAISTPIDTTSKDSLSFSIGDEVTILSKNLKGGEWLGRCKERVGKLTSEGLFKL